MGNCCGRPRPVAEYTDEKGALPLASRKPHADEPGAAVAALNLSPTALSANSDGASGLAAAAAAVASDVVERAVSDATGVSVEQRAATAGDATAEQTPDTASVRLKQPVERSAI